MEAAIPQTGSGWHSGIFRELKILIWLSPCEWSGGLETWREACSHHWRMKFLSGLTGDQAVRTGRSMTQRTCLCNSGEILLYPRGHGQTLKDAKQENNMERIGFSINNSANNEDDELKGSSTICREINRQRHLRKEQSTVLETMKKKSNLLRAGRRVGGGGTHCLVGEEVIDILWEDNWVESRCIPKSWGVSREQGAPVSICSWQAMQPHRARRDQRHCIYQVLCGNRGLYCSFFSRMVLYRCLLVAKCMGIYINGWMKCFESFYFNLE